MRGSKTSASYRAIYTRSFSPSRNPPSSEGTREEAESSQAFYFAHGFLGQYSPSLAEICADDAEATRGFLRFGIKHQLYLAER